MKIKTVNRGAVSLDCSRLLGFSQLNRKSIRAGKRELASGDLAKLGAKVGIGKTIKPRKAT